MIIKPEESRAYRIRRDTTNDVDRVIIDALRRHVAIEMRLEHADHCERCFHAPYTKPPCDKAEWSDANWERIADTALKGGKSDD